MKHPFLITRPNGYIYLVFADQYSGKRKTVSTGTKSKSVANAFLNDWLEKKKQRTNINYILFSKYADVFLELSGYTNILTKQNYKNVSKQFILFLKDRVLQEYSVLDIDRFLKHKQNTTSVHTAHSYRKMLNVMFSKAVHWNYLQKNIIPFCIKFKLPEPSPNPMSKAEFSKLISSITIPMYADLFKFAVLTGMRMSELINLQTSHIDIAKNLIAVRSDSEHKTKSGKTRFIELHKELIPIVEKYQNQKYLFVGNRDKQKLNKKWLIKITKRLIKQSGISPSFHFHSFRSSFGYWLLLENVNIKYISQTLGHSSVVVTERYYSKYLTSENLGFIDKIKLA